MSGLGLDQFLNHNKDGGGSGGKRKFMRNWKKEGQATIWLSTRSAVAYPTWNHPFNSMGVWEDRETKKETETLRFNRFVSPDPEIVHAEQHFRDDNDRMKTPPVRDPFLLLREWLRHECQDPLDAIVFKWVNPKTGEIIEWRRDHLARLADRGKRHWNHSLDTKLEYLFVVVDNKDPNEGTQIVRGTKLLGDKMKAEIGQEIESNGDQGNPMIEPYAFRWIFDSNAKSAMESYRAFRYNKAELTDTIRAAITDQEFPDPTPDTAPREGDKVKIRAAMEDAAQIAIPWDRIFVDAWNDGEEQHTPSVPEVTTPPVVPTQAGTHDGGTPPVIPAQTGTPRRRKKKTAPVPEVVKIACDDCQFMMLPTDSKCSQCGAEYDVDDSPPVVAQEAPVTTPTALPVAKCWGCGAVNPGADRCGECGIDLTEDLPF